MHTFWKKDKKEKNKLSSLPLSMEGQTYLTLGKKRIKNEPSYIVFLHEKSDKPNSGSWLPPFMED